MPVSSKDRERCRALLREGDSIRYLFLGTAIWLGFGPVRAQFYVVVADSEVLVIGRSWFGGRPKAVWHRYPRRIRLGPVREQPSVGPMITLGSLHLEIDEEFVSVIRAADAEISEEDVLPPDPLPDL
ncbi:hypothetical protein [Amycolatopsis cihanbeyliensis]|uniref:PH (Pleckstrin Homology) domain-containing protein n=1 Tax=Amycolatopsis cihanbeyliensis TaxID=1128664 RepID=A0A542DHC3_AMYCI|nr:hypothetical protein [Amycolatopsis cihanbeyliensis]TQJ02487.1 hypothetical protein FB471_2218 [Amycolatopsis cihanbeyliensis]